MNYIVDLDGTISRDDERAHFRTQEPKDWDAYNDACDTDTPIEEVVEIVNALYTAGHGIEIWTGRTENQRAKTKKWLKLYNVDHDLLKMRPDGDFRPSHVIKLEWLGNAEIKPDLVFEDRETEVQSWIDAGLKVLLLK